MDLVCAVVQDPAPVPVMCAPGSGAAGYLLARPQARSAAVASHTCRAARQRTGRYKESTTDVKRIPLRIQGTGRPDTKDHATRYLARL